MLGIVRSRSVPAPRRRSAAGGPRLGRRSKNSGDSRPPTTGSTDTVIPPPGRARSPSGRRAVTRPKEGVTRHVKMAAGDKQVVREVDVREAVVGARVWGHRALPVGAHEHDAGARGQLGVGGEPSLHPAARSSCVRYGRARRRRPGPPARHPPRLREPRRGIGGGSAAVEADNSRRVAARRKRPRQADDHVHHHVAENHDAAHADSSMAIRAASAALRTTSRTFASRLSPPVSRERKSSRYGVTSLPATPARSAAAIPSSSTRSCTRGRAARPRAAGWPPAPRARRCQVRRSPHHGRHLRRGVHPPPDRMARVREVEARETIRAVAEHAHVERLQPLERGPDVEDRLHAGAHHHEPVCASVPRSADSSQLSRARR